MKLSGWQRLWIVFAVPYLLGWLALGIVGWINRAGEDRSDLVLLVLAFGVAPPVLVYLLGLGIAWAIRGFREQ